MEVVWTLCSIGVLAAAPFVAEKVRFSAGTRRRGVSFAGGVALAYVFVHILPELSAHQYRLKTDPRSRGLLLDEFYVYLIALGSFVLFFGLERLLCRVDHRQAAAEDQRRGCLFSAHLASTALNYAIIGYLISHDIDRQTVSLALSTFALALHFLAIDYNLSHHNRRWYDRLGRWLLACAVFSGWVFARLVDISGEPEAMLFAFMAGTVTVNSIKDEIPAESGGSFGLFCLGASVFTIMQLAAFSVQAH